MKFQRGPATVIGSFVHEATVLVSMGRCIKSDDQEPGDLPVLAPSPYEDREVFGRL